MTLFDVIASLYNIVLHTCTGAECLFSVTYISMVALLYFDTMPKC